MSVHKASLTTIEPQQATSQFGMSLVKGYVLAKYASQSACSD